MSGEPFTALIRNAATGVLFTRDPGGELVPYSP